MRRLLLILILLFPTTVFPSGECLIQVKPTLEDYLTNRTSDGRFIPELYEGKKLAGWSIRSEFNRLLYLETGYSHICPPQQFLPKEPPVPITTCFGWQPKMSHVPDIGRELLWDYVEQSADKHSPDEDLILVLRSALQDKWPCGFVQRMMHRIKHSWMWDEDDFFTEDESA